MYYDTGFKGEQLFDLPPYGSFPIRGSYKVTGVEQPVREVEAKTSIRDEDRPLSDRVGVVCAVKYLDGTEREVYVPFDNQHKLDLTGTVFLRAGRKSDLLNEIWDLEIPRETEAVPDHVIAKIRETRNAQESANAARRLENG